MTGSTNPDFDSLTVDGTLTVNGSIVGGGAFLPLSGGTVSGALTASTSFTLGSNTLNGVAQVINGVSGGVRWTRWRTAGVDRWQMGPFGAETGSNAGSDLVIGAFSDAGANLSRGITLTRASGGLTLTTNNALTLSNTSANGISTGFWGSSTFSGQSGVNGVLDLNRWGIHDTVDHSIALNITNGLTIEHDYGGGTTKGGRNAFNVLLLQTAANTDTGADNFYGAGTFYSFARYTQPGATASAPLGSFIAFNTNGQAQNGFTPQNLRSMVSYEADVGLSAGSSAWQRTCVQLVNLNDGQAYGVDNALWIYSSSITTGLGTFKTGIMFGDTQQWPIDTNGTIIGANMGATAHATPYLVAKWGIDFDQVVCPATGNPYDGGILRAPNASLDGNGRLQLGSGYLTPSSAGLAVDAKGSSTTAAAIAAAGSGYENATHYFTTAYGGVFQISVNISGIPNGAVTQISPAQFPTTSPPANPIAAIDLSHTPMSTATPGTGLTLNLTWNTTATTLSLNPSGGPIKGPLLPNFANDAAAAGGGVAVGQFYRNGSVVMQRVA